MKVATFEQVDLQALLFMKHDGPKYLVDGSLEARNKEIPGIQHATASGIFTCFINNEIIENNFLIFDPILESLYFHGQKRDKMVVMIKMPICSGMMDSSIVIPNQDHSVHLIRKGFDTSVMILLDFRESRDIDGYIIELEGNCNIGEIDQGCMKACCFLDSKEFRERGNRRIDIVRLVRF